MGVGPGQPVEASHAAARIARQGMRSINQGAEAQLGAEGRVFQVAAQLGGDSSRHPAECLRGEGRPKDHVGEQLERQGQVLAADAQRAPGRPDFERAADVFDLPGQFLGGSGRRPLLQQPAGQSRPGRAWPRGAVRRRRTARARRPRCPAGARRSAAGRCPARSGAGGSRRAGRSPRARRGVRDGCGGRPSEHSELSGGITYAAPGGFVVGGDGCREPRRPGSTRPADFPRIGPGGCALEELTSRAVRFWSPRYVATTRRISRPRRSERRDALPARCASRPRAPRCRGRRPGSPGLPAPSARPPRAGAGIGPARRPRVRRREAKQLGGDPPLDGGRIHARRPLQAG